MVGYFRGVYTRISRILRNEISTKIAPTKSLRQVHGCGFLLILQKLILRIAAILKFMKYIILLENNPLYDIHEIYTPRK